MELLMLKYVTLFLMILVCQSLTEARTPCETTSDCARGECCKTDDNHNDMDGKRQVASYCAPRANVGASCYVNKDIVYQKACPCQSVARCFGTGEHDEPHGEVGVCRGIFIG